MSDLCFKWAKKGLNCFISISTKSSLNDFSRVQTKQVYLSETFFEIKKTKRNFGKGFLIFYLSKIIRGIAKNINRIISKNTKKLDLKNWIIFFLQIMIQIK
jgi:hypothetical protein